MKNSASHNNIEKALQGHIRGRDAEVRPEFRDGLKSHFVHLGSAAERAQTFQTTQRVVQTAQQRPMVKKSAFSFWRIAFAGVGAAFAVVLGVALSDHLGTLTQPFDNQSSGSTTGTIAFVNNGKVCVKNGPLHFRATGTRKYWRLKEKDNCEGGNVVDYFDIYF